MDGKRREDLGTSETIAEPNVATSETLAADPTRSLGGAHTIASTAASPSRSRGGGTSSGGAFPGVAQGRYQLLGEVGRGGLGHVIEARDLLLDRRVAVKELIDPGDAAQRRFVREAMITARLQHPAIVPVYDAGHGDPTGPFYAMKLVAGRSLADAMKGLASLEARLGLLPSVIAVADAMAYAHSEKIIHRDLKPQNILVGDFGETVVIDWGLAKDLAGTDDSDDERDVSPYRAAASGNETVAGALLGTPAYMAPEQARGEAVDERADVYALGAMIYQLVSGEAPHRGTSMDEMIAGIVKGEVTPIAEKEPRTPDDLAAIVTKAMALAPADRYRTARELADDLHRFQTGHYVGARTYTAVERFRRWLRRHRTIVAVSAIAIVVLASYGVWSMKRIVDEKEISHREMVRAKEAARVAEAERAATQTRAMLLRAQQYANTGHSAEEIAILRALARPEAGAESRRLAVEAGLIWKSHQRLASAAGETLGGRSLDGRTVVTREAAAIVARDVATGAVKTRFTLPAAPADSEHRLVAVSPTARYVLAGHCTRGCRLQVESSTEVPGTWLAVVDTDELAIVEVATGKRVVAWTASSQPAPFRIEWAPDDRAIAMRTPEQLSWVAPANRPAADVRGCFTPTTIEPTSGALAIACSDAVRVIAVDGSETKLPTKNSIVALAFTTPTTLLALGARVELWNLPRQWRIADTEWAAPPEPAIARELVWQPQPPPDGRTWHAPREVRLTTSSITVRTPQMTAPWPQTTGNRTVLSAPGDWRAVFVEHDRVRIATIDAWLPGAVKDSACLDYRGGEARAMLALDGGARLLIDEQELPIGLDAQVGAFRSTTTDEAPVRQLRPSHAIETHDCLFWERTIAPPHTRIASGPLEILPDPQAHGEQAMPILRPPFGWRARIQSDGRGGLLVAGRALHRVAADGTVTRLAAFDDPVLSPGGTYVASIDPAGAVVVHATATGDVVRRWAAAPDAILPRGGGLGWAAVDVVAVNIQNTTERWTLVPIDPALPTRSTASESGFEPRSPFAIETSGGTATVRRVRDGVAVAVHRDVDAVELVPDASGRVLVRDPQQVVRAIAIDGTAVTLATSELPDQLESAGDLVRGTLRGVAGVFDLKTGKRLEVPDTIDAGLATFVTGTTNELWWIEVGTAVILHRKPIAGGAPRTITLSTKSIAPRDLSNVRGDGRYLRATFGVTETHHAEAMWDAESGTLVWIGPPEARPVGGWIVNGAVGYIPSFDVDAILANVGARTNLRVCQGDLRVVGVEGATPDSYWASPETCRAASARTMMK